MPFLSLSQFISRVVLTLCQEVTDAVPSEDYVEQNPHGFGNSPSICDWPVPDCLGLLARHALKIFEEFLDGLIGQEAIK